MRRSDSSPPIPPRFVAFARRYHPSTCGFAPSDARCAVHGLGFGEPVPAPRQTFKMETMRPPGFPGNPPVRMPRAPTPARSPPPRPLRGGDVAFRPTQDVGPRDQRISGLNPAAYALPVNASRPGSPQAHASLGSGWRPTLAGWDRLPTGFRTRFRRSRHLVPLDRAFPAHALVHESKLARNAFQRVGSSPTDRERLWSTTLGHPIEHVARKHRFNDLPDCSPGAQAIAENRLVPEEGVLHPRLAMVSRLLLPPAPTHLRDRSDCATARPRARSTSG